MGDLEGLRSRWDESASDYAHWVELLGEPIPLDWYKHALLRLHVRDRDGYRRACLCAVGAIRPDGRPGRGSGRGPRLHPRGRFRRSPSQASFALAEKVSALNRATAGT